MEHLLTIIYVASIFLAFLSSLICFRLDFPFHLKMFSVLLGVTFLVEFFVAFIVHSFHLKNNFRIYNCFAPIEFWMYGYYYYRLVEIKTFRRVIYLFLLLFPLFCILTEIFVFKFEAWNSYEVICGSFFSIVFALMYFYQVIINRKILSLRNLPEFWIAMAMLIFYVGALPYFGTLNFLVRLSVADKKYESLLVDVVYVFMLLDTFMYCLFTYGFIWQMINTKRSR